MSKSIQARARESTLNRIHYINSNSENGSIAHIEKADKQVEIQNYILDLIDRDTKKPIEFNHVGYNECPSCGFIVETDDYFCSNCGQRIYLDISSLGEYIEMGDYELDKEKERIK